MRVRNLAGWAGDNFSYQPGDLIEMDDATAKARIEAGLAAEDTGEPTGPVVHKLPPPTLETKEGGRGRKGGR